MNTNTCTPARERYLIVNADDFGASDGVNRAIVDCHCRGVVTSTSLMVRGRALEQALDLSRANPGLAIGLHFDLWGEDERDWDTTNLPATRDEFRRQFDRFMEVMGRQPTHIDSHRHAHRQEHLFPHFLEWTADCGVPVRGDGKVRFIGNFYAQWEWMVTDLAHVSVAYLEEMVRTETPPGYTEFSCHPGYVTADYQAVYLAEREHETRTLVDPRIRRAIQTEGVRLISYADYPRLSAARA